MFSLFRFPLSLRVLRRWHTPGMLRSYMSCSSSTLRIARVALSCIAVAWAGLLLGSPRAWARPQDTGFLNRSITSNGTVYHYSVYLPTNWSPKQKWPVILFLHGSGERGSDGLDETQVGLPNALRSHNELWPFVVVMPQVPYNHRHWTDPDIMAMAMGALHAEVKEFHGDPQRLYLTGMSLGGYGVWEIAKDYPGQFAAIAPVCGGNFLVIRSAPLAPAGTGAGIRKGRRPHARVDLSWQ